MKNLENLEIPYMRQVTSIWNRSRLYGTGHAYMEQVTPIWNMSRLYGTCHAYMEHVIIRQGKARVKARVKARPGKARYPKNLFLDE
jgi:hypothetical protein